MSYPAQNDVEYLASEHVHHCLSICCSVMLIMGILAVANAQIQLQIAFACAYISLNAAYLAIANRPARGHWDLSSFEIRRQKIGYADVSDEARDPWIDHNKSFTRAQRHWCLSSFGIRRQTTGIADISDAARDTWTDYNKTFTRALWKTIAVSKSSNWCKWSNVVPVTPVWHRWLVEAQEEAENVTCTTGDDGNKVWELPAWNPETALHRLLTEPDYWELESFGASNRSSYRSRRASLKQAQPGASRD